ncbi:MAG: c-type cytochrome, partial [Dehalococcoidia bacterium]
MNGKLWISLVAALALGIAIACGGETSTSTPVPQPSPTPVTEITDEGYRLFISKGCSACHGQDAQGTAIAPALPGHSAAIVRRQARAPVGVMPVFPPDKITNEELDRIAGFVASLPGGHLHERPADVGQAVAVHHWMALLSLAENEVPEAIHHVGHIIELVEGDHLARMQAILQQLEEGEIHEAAHGIQVMLAGTAVPGLSVTQMHLQMALSGIRVEDLEGTIHHMNHFLETAQGTMREQGQAILAAIQSQELPEAEHLIEELLGVEGEEHEEGHTDEEGHAHDE